MARPTGNGMFIDAALQAEFDRHGYVVWPLLEPWQVQALITLYEESAERRSQADLYNSVFSSDVDRRRRVHEGIRTICEPRFRKLLPGYRTLLASFIAKAPHSTRGTVPLHQDYSFIDPRTGRGVNAWVPLTRVDESNGCLRVVPGSHRAFDSLGVAGGILPSFMPVADRLLEEFSAPVPMKAGSAVIWDSRVLHASEDNRSDEWRIAAGSSLIPEESGPRLYYAEDPAPDSVEEFAVDTEFLMRYRPGSRPDGAYRLGALPHEPAAVGAPDLERLRAIQAELALAPAEGGALPRGEDR